MTAMVNLRVFLSERLSSAALEISEEVEKVLSVYQAEVSRSREEIRHLQKQMGLQLRQLKDHPYINNGVVHGEEASLSPRLVNVATAIKLEEGSMISTMDYEDSDHSRANVDSAPSNAEIQTDVPTIKEEQQEVLCIDSTTTNTTAPFVNTVPEQSDMELRVTYKMPDFVSTCESAVDSTDSNAEIQADVPTIKEEQEVLCIKGEGWDTASTTTTMTGPFVNTVPEQSDVELRVTYKMPDFVSTCESAVDSAHSNAEIQADVLTIKEQQDQLPENPAGQARQRQPRAILPKRPAKRQLQLSPANPGPLSPLDPVASSAPPMPPAPALTAPPVTVPVLRPQFLTGRTPGQAVAELQIVLPFAVTSLERAASAGTVRAAGAFFKRPYKRTVQANTCKRCGQFRTAETRHSQYRGRVFCPFTEALTKEQWFEKMKLKFPR